MWERKKLTHKLLNCRGQQPPSCEEWALIECLPSARRCCASHNLSHLVLRFPPLLVLLLTPFYEVKEERLPKWWAQDSNPGCLAPKPWTLCPAPYAGQWAGADCWPQAWRDAVAFFLVKGKVCYFKGKNSTFLFCRALHSLNKGGASKYHGIWRLKKCIYYAWTL